MRIPTNWYATNIPSKAHPFGHFISRFVKDIDENPKVQLRIHTIGFYYWTINFPIVTYLFFYQPDMWLKYGLFITLIYSIYANWSTDYAGMSSAQAVINTSKDIEIVTTGDVNVQKV